MSDDSFFDNPLHKKTPRPPLRSWRISPSHLTRQDVAGIQRQHYALPPDFGFALHRFAKHGTARY